MDNAISQLKTVTTSVRLPRETPTRLKGHFKLLRASVLEVKPDLLKSNPYVHFQICAEKFTTLITILKDRLTYSAHGSTKKTLVYVLLTLDSLRKTR